MKKVFMILVAVVVIAMMASLAHAFPAVEVYKTASPAVVLIVASQGGSSSMIGAGSVITDSGYVITNAHVVIDDETGGPFSKVRVYTRPVEITGDFQRDLTNKYDATVVRYDRDLDLALLKVEGLGGDTGAISLANPGDIMVGEEVVAIGHPEQGGLWTLTYGRISGHKANQANIRGKDVYQTDTSVNRGNSGGPLLDKRGYLVGVNTNIARTGAGGLAITGVNFALKSSVVHSWLKESYGMDLDYGRRPLNAAEPAPMQQAEPMAPAAPAPAEEPAPMKAEPAPMKAEPAAPAPEPEQKTAPEPEQKTAPEPVPTPAPEPAPAPEPESKPKMEVAPVKVIEKPTKSDTILTPKKPFKNEDLYKAVERDMENLMDEMKGSFKKKRKSR